MTTGDGMDSLAALGICISLIIGFTQIIGCEKARLANDAKVEILKIKQGCK